MSDTKNRTNNRRRKLSAISLANILENDQLYRKHVFKVISILTRKLNRTLLFQGTSFLPEEISESLKASGQLLEFRIEKQKVLYIYEDIETRTDTIANHSNLPTQPYGHSNSCPILDFTSPIFIELVTVMLCTHLRHKLDNKTRKCGPRSLHHHITTGYGGMLLDAFENISIDIDTLKTFFTKHRFPLPSSLYPGDDHNTEAFLCSYNISPLFNGNLFDVFKDFFKSKPSKELTKFCKDKLATTSERHNNPRLPNAAPERIKSTNDYEFYLNGDFWRCTFNGLTREIKTSDGMHYLKILLENSDKSFHPINLFDSLPWHSSVTQCVQDDSGDNLIEHINEYFKNTGYSILGKELNLPSIKNPKKLKTVLLENLAEKKDLGHIDEHTYTEEVKHLNEAFSIYFTRGKLPRDKSLKSKQDTVRSRIKYSLAKIKSSHIELFNHLSHILHDFDPKLNRVKTYTYRPQRVIKWKLS